MSYDQQLLERLALAVYRSAYRPAAGRYLVIPLCVTVAARNEDLEVVDRLADPGATLSDDEVAGRRGSLVQRQLIERTRKDRLEFAPGGFSVFFQSSDENLRGDYTVTGGTLVPFDARPHLAALGDPRRAVHLEDGVNEVNRAILERCLPRERRISRERHASLVVSDRGRQVELFAEDGKPTSVGGVPVRGSKRLGPADILGFGGAEVQLTWRWRWGEEQPLDPAGRW